MLKIVKRDDDEFRRWVKKRQIAAAAKYESSGIDIKDSLASELGWLVGLGEYEGRKLEFDPYQALLLTRKESMRSQLKARQIGFSFCIAAESLARCHLKQKHTSVFVSYNLDDAKEKIIKVKELHEGLPLEFQKKVVEDSKTVVSFRSNDRFRRLSKVISYPSKAPRGKTGDIYLDELAHCQNDRSIYSGATALIIRSGGQLTIGSTPLGQRGMFYAIHSDNSNTYPGFWRQSVPWWLCSQFCHSVRKAAVTAPDMPTEERVLAFGSKRLIEQFYSLPREAFQQEYELAFQDELVSFFPYELIMPCTREAQDMHICDNAGMLVEKAATMGPLYAGFDVGRTRHPSELTVFAKTPDDRYEMVFRRTYRNTPFPKQRQLMDLLIRKLGSRLVKFRIDATGLGKNLAEDLKRKHGSKVEEVVFTGPTKESLANSLKIAMQERGIIIPKDRELIAQIHSVRQKFTAAGNTVFDVDQNAKGHHADALWAIAMATWKIYKTKKVAGRVGARVIGNSVERIVDRRDLSLVEKLFADVSRKPTREEIIKAQEDIARREHHSNKVSRLDTLIAKACNLKMAAVSYRRNRDMRKFEELRAKYKLVVAEINARRAA